MTANGNRRNGHELKSSVAPTLEEATRWIGSRVDDIHRTPIGRLEDVWEDPATGEPLWLLVRTTTTGDRRTLVPLAEASRSKRGVWIRLDREFVRSAPAVRRSAELTGELSAAFKRYYGVGGHRYERPATASPAAGPSAHIPTGFLNPRPMLRRTTPAPAAVSAKAVFMRPGVQSA